MRLVNSGGHVVITSNMREAYRMKAAGYVDQDEPAETPAPVNAPAIEPAKASDKPTKPSK